MSQPTTSRIPISVLVASVVVLLFTLAGHAQTPVETFTGDFTIDYFMPGNRQGTGASFQFNVIIDALDFTPGAVMFNGQPIDFDGTEGDFLGTIYNGIIDVQSGPTPTLDPLTVRGFGLINASGAVDSNGPTIDEQLNLGPDFSESFFHMVPSVPFHETWQFTNWQSPVIPQLNGSTVRWVIEIVPNVVDPTLGVIQGPVSGTIFAVNPPLVENFQFGQLNWLDEDQVLLVPDSSWGVIEFDYFPHPIQTFYLSVDVDNGGPPIPAVRNYPLFPQTVVGVSGLKQESVDFDISALGLTPGMDLPSLNFAIAVEPFPTLVPVFLPPLPAPVIDIERYSYGARIGGPGLPTDVGKPSGVQNNDKPKSVMQHKDVPAVQEASDQCLPGSMARSISWLLKKNNLGNRSGQDTYGDLVAFDNPTRLSYEAFVAKKAEYLKNKSKQRGVTKILDLDNSIGTVTGVQQETGTDLITWLKKEFPTEDVELHYDKHIITVTGYYETGSGSSKKTFVKYRDDEKQGDDTKGDTKEKKAELRKNPDGSYSFRQAGSATFFKVRAAISESVPSKVSVSKSSAGAVLLSWDPGGFRDQFDLTTGSLSQLRATHGDFAGATAVQCVSNDVPAPPEPLDVTSIPVLPGDAAWFVHRPVVVGQNGTYNSLGAGQIGDRDVMATNPSSCPSCLHDVCLEGQALTPGCDDTDLVPITPDCVEIVCTIDAFCCSVEWETVCVQIAETECGVPCLPR